MFKELGCLLLGLLLLGNAAADDKLTLQLNWQHQFEYAGFYAAQKEGYYRDAGLDVEILPWNGIYGLDALRNGTADIAIMGSPVLEKIAQGADLQLLGATFQHSPLVFLAHEPILSLQSQLRGKRIMGAATFELKALLRRARLGPKEVQLLPHSHGLQAFIRGEVDLLTVFSTNQPFQLRDAGIPFWILDPKSFGIDSYQDLWVVDRQQAASRPQLFARFRQASLRGWRYALEHPLEMVDYIKSELGSSKTRQQLVEEMESSVPLMDTGEVPFGTVDKQRLQQLLQQQAQLGFISEQQQSQLKIEDILFKGIITDLTREELAWIREHPQVRLANDIAWPPFEYIDEQGQYRGMIVELLQLVAQKSGLKFVPTTDKSWQEVVKGMQNGELDMFSAAVATPERKKYARFTEPFFRFPMVALAREGHAVITDLTQLPGETIGVVEGYSSDEVLSSMPLQSDLKRFATVQEGVKALLNGKIDLMLDNLVSLNYLIREQGLDGLVVVGQIEQPFELAMGVRKDLPILYSIISKALASIQEQEKQAIYNRWLQLKIVQKTDHSLLLQVVAIASGVILILFALIGWQRRLRKRLNHQLHEVQELSLSCVTDPDGKILQCTHSFSQLLGTSSEALIGRTHPLFEQENLPEILAQLGKTGVVEREIQLQTDVRRTLHLQFRISTEAYNKPLRTLRITCKDRTSERLLERASLQDSLTGLSNRRQFNQVFDKEVLRARRDHQPFYWAMLDLDHFKDLNDDLGHQKGDEALQQVAQVLQTHFNRAGDEVFRLGGEEFGLKLQLAKEEELKPKLEALKQAIEQLGIPNPSEPRGVLTISIGAVIVPPDQHARPEKIYQQADEMLYRAKAAGRNKVIIKHLAGDIHKEKTNS